MQTYQKILIAGVILFILGIHFIARPIMYRQKATQTLETILANWKDNNFTFNHMYWIDRSLIPPINQISDYKIIHTHFTGFKKGYFIIQIDLPDGAILPSGKTWKVEMINTRDGWKVENFVLQK